ncbi:phosphohydrolase [Nocardia sp. NPDC051570]|uniref:phosphohydrolase n=1 Tax=Nocardia sp. NPDC051570 TaxID=3364324 RepID=UPI0037ABF3DD
MNDEILNWEWAKSSSGNLTARQKRQLTRMVAKETPAAVASALRYRLGTRGTGRTDLATIPDSRLARQAEEEARESLSPYLLEHSYRSYFFGRVLAGIDGARVDDELVYVSSLLHDLTLDTPTPGQCFAYVSGARAAELARSWGADPDWAEAVGAAGCGHLTPGAGLDDPAAFVLAGSSVDAIGRRMEEFDPAWVTELLGKHPRHGLKRNLVAAMRAEARAVPDGRVRHADRAGTVSFMIRRAPFPE